MKGKTFLVHIALRVQIEMALMKLQAASKPEELLFWGKVTGNRAFPHSFLRSLR